MSEVPYREYWDRKVPMEGTSGAERFATAQVRLDTAWKRLQRSYFVTMPNQLDRTRLYRNRFIRAVQ